MTDERKCLLCDGGSEVIDGWHYIRVGGMVFPTNRRCEKIYPPKPRPTRLKVFMLPSLQCATCGQRVEWQPARQRGERPSETTEYWPAECTGCHVVVLVPLTLRDCQVIG